MTFCGKLPQGLLFLKMTPPGILGHVNFEEIALLLIFGPNDGGGNGGGFPRTLCIWLSPGSITPRDQISRSGNPSLRHREKEQYVAGYKGERETNRQRLVLILMSG